MNEENNATLDREAKVRKNKRRIITVLIITGVVLLALTIIIAILEMSEESFEVETWGSVDPSLLEDTKDEDFDIMEYDEYLGLNRLVMYQEGNISTSIDDKTVQKYNDSLILMYDLIGYIIAGDSEGYNSLVYPKEDKKKDFTQQQLYDILIIRHSRTQMKGDNGIYTEYVYKLEYKIHENNGSFRNDIEPDAARAQYFVINDSTGTLMVMDIINRGYLK